MIVIGIVGPPAGGKSTVAKQLTALGAVWLDADTLAHQVLDQAAVQAQLRQHFGDRVVREGKIDRKWLGSQVFGADSESQGQLEWLQTVVHPPTRLLLQTKLIQAAADRAAAVLLDVPLLFEAGWDVYCDQIWCLDTPLVRRLEWVKERGWTAEELHQREQRQLPLAEKKRRSTHIISNSGDLSDLSRQVRALWDALPTGSQANATTDEHQADEHCTGPHPDLP